jgi:hypothetical protein
MHTSKVFVSNDNESDSFVINPTLNTEKPTLNLGFEKMLPDINKFHSLLATASEITDSKSDRLTAFAEAENFQLMNSSMALIGLAVEPSYRVVKTNIIPGTATPSFPNHSTDRFGSVELNLVNEKQQALTEKDYRLYSYCSAYVKDKILANSDLT